MKYRRIFTHMEITDNNKVKWPEGLELPIFKKYKCNHSENIYIVKNIQGKDNLVELTVVNQETDGDQVWTGTAQEIIEQFEML